MAATNLKNIIWKPAWGKCSNPSLLFSKERFKYRRPHLQQLQPIPQNFLSAYRSRRCFRQKNAKSTISPWWSPDAAKISASLWLPSRATEVAGQNVVGLTDTWFSSKKVHQCSVPQPIQSKYLADHKLTLGNTKITRTVKILLLPNEKQRKALDLAIQAYKVTRASCVRWIRRNQKKANQLAVAKDKINPLLAYLRENFVSASNNKGVCKVPTNNYFADKKWMLAVPKEIRFSAVKDVVANLKTCLTNLERGHAKRFKMKIKISTSHASVGIEKKFHYNSSLQRLQFGFKFFEANGASPDIRCDNVNLPLLPADAKGIQHPECDSKIHRSSTGEYYLLATYNVAKSTEGHDMRPVISGDMGVRKFITTYTSDGQCHSLGEKTSERLSRYIKQRSKIQSLLARGRGGNSKAVKQMKKSYERYGRKMINLRDELHRKLASWITSNYSMIILPRLRVNQLICKDGNMHKTTKKVLAALGVYKFYERLTAKCEQKHVLLINGDESYTTKTCDRCGTLNERVGGKEWFSCSCGHELDRDAHSARAIMIKNNKIYSLAGP